MPATDTFLWTDPQVLVTVDGVEPALAVSSVVNASWLLWMLSGQKLHTVGTRRDIFQMVPGGRLQIKLTMHPVTEILSINVVGQWDGEEVELTQYTDWALTGSTLDFRGGMCTTDTMRIEYSVGSNLPVSTDAAVLALAREYIAAATGTQCNLPDRVTSISRQGQTWTILDPGEFLKEGRTGVMAVDQWLIAVNPKHNAQEVRLFDPSLPRLVSSVWFEDPTDVLTITSSTGQRTFLGHGPPPDTLTGTTSDRYVDLDTGRTYTLA